MSFTNSQTIACQRTRSLRHGVLLALACMLGASDSGFAQGKPDESSSAQAWIDSFASDWDESRWEKKFRGVNGFMRKEGDTQWRSRMLALQGVVGQGKKAVPALLEQLKHADAERRIFAAQALRYLAPHAPPAALLKAARDANATVRLYAVDALGMRGGDDTDFAALKKSERMETCVPTSTMQTPVTVPRSRKRSFES